MNVGDSYSESTRPQSSQTIFLNQYVSLSSNYSSVLCLLIYLYTRSFVHILNWHYTYIFLSDSYAAAWQKPGARKFAGHLQIRQIQYQIRQSGEFATVRQAWLLLFLEYVDLVSCGYSFPARIYFPVIIVCAYLPSPYRHVIWWAAVKPRQW